MSQPQGDGPWVDVGRDLCKLVGTGSLSAMIGKSGVGKTQIAANLIYSVIKNTGKGCLYCQAMDIFFDLKACYKKNSETVEREVIHEYLQPTLLVIDEFDKRGETAWEDTMLETLLIKRYGAMKDTVIIANWTAQALEQAIGPAMVSRMNESGMIASCDWPSFREGK